MFYVRATELITLKSNRYLLIVVTTFNILFAFNLQLLPVYLLIEYVTMTAVSRGDTVVAAFRNNNDG